MNNKNRRYALMEHPHAMVRSLPSDFEKNKGMPSEALNLRKVEIYVRNITFSIYKLY
jgi:hypothetical protein